MLTIPTVLSEKLPGQPPPSLPSYAREGDAGMDLRAHLHARTYISPGTRQTISTGISIAIPEGFEGQIRSRSGLAARNGVFVLNSPGTIDSGYRGEILVILFNSGENTFIIDPGDRIAQIVFAPVARATLAEVDKLDASARGANGLGSTDVASPSGGASPSGVASLADAFA